MTQSDERATQPSGQDVALIVGGGPGISSSCARLFAKNGMRVGIAARNPDKAVLQNLEKTHTARADTHAMRAIQRPWSCYSKMLFETLGRLHWSSTTSTAGFPRYFASISPKLTRASRSRPFATQRSARFWLVSRQPG